jgi:hypothetical protein
MVDPCSQTCLAEGLIRDLRPTLPNRQILVLGGPCDAKLASLTSGQLQIRSSSEPVRCHFTSGHQQVRVVISDVGAGSRPMTTDVYGAPIFVSQLRREPANELDALLCCQLHGHEHEPFAGEA